MSFRGTLKTDASGIDLFAALRELERSTPSKPRIGDSAVILEDVVALGEEPFLEFPDTNLTRYEEREGAAPLIYTRFLGFFGPQGALPLSTTVETHQWLNRRDPSFARFIDIFGNRFRQLFYRAWADSRPAAHHDRPDDDRFFRYVASFAGIGVDSLAEQDSLPDIAKLPFAGLVGPAVKSAARLCQLIRGALHVDVRIDERVGSWLAFEPDDYLRLGEPGTALGATTFLGKRSYSINDKFSVAIRARDLDEYRRFLPNGSGSDTLTDLIFFYVGHRFEFDVRLALPARAAPPTRLGVSGELGWTAWVAPRADAAADDWLEDARFDVLERRRAAAAARPRS